jgi:hypothetical protein
VLRWRTGRRFDLITCVHGLHYLGDKLAALALAAGLLAPDGLFQANLDVGSIRVEGVSRSGITAALRRAGFEVNSQRRLISCVGSRAVRFPFVYLGADDAAGPNYTGQAAVESHYRLA